jgi:hypothetical protein
MAEDQAGRPLTLVITGTERVVGATLEHHVLHFNYGGHPRTVEPRWPRSSPAPRRSRACGPSSRAP